MPCAVPPDSSARPCRGSHCLLLLRPLRRSRAVRWCLAARRPESGSAPVKELRKREETVLEPRRKEGDLRPCCSANMDIRIAVSALSAPTGRGWGPPSPLLWHFPGTSTALGVRRGAQLLASPDPAAYKRASKQELPARRSAAALLPAPLCAGQVPPGQEDWVRQLWGHLYW